MILGQNAQTHFHGSSPGGILAWANRLLLLGIVLVNGYIIVTPFWPNIEYHIKTLTVKELPKSQFKDVDRSRDHIIIPRLRLDKEILIGSNSKLVDMGIWQRPNASTPDKGSNTVLVGHRFLYKNPESAVFYNLDKIKKNDPIVVVWSGKVYVYEVRDIHTVLPEETSIESPTSDKRLTLYTCTPLFSTSHRLVVVANLKEVL